MNKKAFLILSIIVNIYNMEVIMEVHWNISGFFCHSYRTSNLSEISQSCPETVSNVMNS